MLMLRKILFYVFVLIYLVTAPLVIMHALGINYQPDTKTLEKTGLIYLSSIPSQARVTINAEQYPQETPVVLRGLAPGSYKIKISKETYKDWRKNLPVEAQKATVVESVLLIPKKWKKENLKTEFKKMITFADPAFFLVNKGPSLKDFFLYKERAVLGENLIGQPPLIDKENLLPLIENSSSLDKAKISRIYTVRNAAQMLLKIDHDKKEKFFWINLKEEPPAVEEISPFMLKDYDKILWDPRHPDSLYLLHQEAISRFDLKEKIFFPDIVGNVKSFTAQNGRLYVLHKENVLIEYTQDAQEAHILLEAEKIKKILLKPYRDLDIFILEPDLIVFLSENGALLSNQQPLQLVPEGVQGFTFNQKRKRLLFWTGHRLGTIDFLPDDTQASSEKIPKPAWFGVQSKNIRQAAWANEGSHVIYATHDKIYITETQAFGQPIIQVIADIRPSSPFVYWDKLGKIFFLDEKTGYLSALTVIEQPALFSAKGAPDAPKGKEQK